jgi:Spy/CpxP family protein refolding chaperone
MRTRKLLVGILTGGLVLAGGVTLASSLMAQAPASSESNGGPGAYKGRPILNFIRNHFHRAWDMRSKLNLSDDQKTKIRQTVAGHKTEIAGMVKEVGEKRQALRDAVLAETPNETAIRAAADELGKAIGDAAVKASKIVGEVRKDLTPEQVEKIRKFRENQRAEFEKALDKALGE